MHRHAAHCAWHADSWGCGEEQLVIFAPVKRQVQRQARRRYLRRTCQRMNGQRGFLNDGRDARSLAQVSEVRGEAVAQVDARVRQPAQAAADGEARLGKEMRVRLPAPSATKRVEGPRITRQAAQLSRGPAERACYIEPISRPRSGAQQRLAVRHLADRDNIGKDRACVFPRQRGRLRRVPACQGNAVLRGERQKPVEESPKPASRQLARQSQRQKYGDRLCSHRRQVAQATRKASVPHRFRRMPRATKVNTLERKIRRHAQLIPRPRSQKRAVIANPQPHRARASAAGARLAADGLKKSQLAGERAGCSGTAHGWSLTSIEKKLPSGLGFRNSFSLCFRHRHEPPPPHPALLLKNRLCFNVLSGTLIHCVSAMSLQSRIEEHFAAAAPEVGSTVAMAAFLELRDALEAGTVRAAEPDASTPIGWRVNAWVKQGILLGFRLGQMEGSGCDDHASLPSGVQASIPGGVSEGKSGLFLSSGYPFVDKHTYPPRRFSAGQGIRIVPGGSSVRAGAYLARGVVAMPPSYVNVGAWVDEGTMIDSHALVGSCAQIGKRVHLSAAAQVGGVLEPVNASPVILEDEVLVGGNCGVYEGTIVRRRAVLAAGTILTRGTPVYDTVRGEILRADAETPLIIPEGAVVVPGARAVTQGKGLEWKLSVYTPVIVKYRDEKTELSLALEDLLR